MRVAISGTTHTSDWFGCKCGLSYSPHFTFNNLLEGHIQLTESSILMIIVLLERNSQIGEMHRARSALGGEEGAVLLCPLPVGSGCVTLPAHQCIHQPGSRAKTPCPEFLWRFHYMGMIDSTICHVTGSVSRPSLLPKARGVELKVPNLSSRLIFLLWPELSKHPPWVTLA